MKTQNTDVRGRYYVPLFFIVTYYYRQLKPVSSIYSPLQRRLFLLFYKIFRSIPRTFRHLEICQKPFPVFFPPTSPICQIVHRILVNVNTPFLCIIYFFHKWGENKMRLMLRDLREDKDLRQEDLAKLLNCKQQTYSRYELGIVTPPLQVMEVLSRFYKTSVDYLMGLTDIKSPYPKTK